MFYTNIKKIGMILCVATLCSCSIFNGDKDLPTGKRVSILDTKYSYTNFANKAVNSIPIATSDKNWLQSGGNSAHVVGNIGGSKNMFESWKTKFGKGADKRNLMLAQPIIVNDTIYTQDVEATVKAFNLKTGNQIWKTKIKPANKNISDNGLNGIGLASDEHKIFAVTGFGSIIALDAKDGKQIWRIDLNTLVRTSPSICSDKLIIQTLDNKLIVLNTTDGSERFKYNTSSEDTILAGGAVPACSNEKGIIVAGFSNGQVEAFNADLGYPLWTVNLVNPKNGSLNTNINAIKASPIIDGDIVYAIGNNDMLIATDYRTGETIWSQEISSTNTPWIAGKYMYIISDNNDLICVDKISGEIIYGVKLLTEYDLKEKNGIYLSGPIMTNGKLLVTASNGVVYAISPYDGTIEHKIDLKEELPYSPISANNSVVFATSKANLIVYK